MGISGELITATTAYCKETMRKLLMLQLQRACVACDEATDSRV